MNTNFKSSHSIAISIVLLLSGLTLAATPQTVNPNNDDPFLSLAVYGDTSVAKLQNQAQDRYTIAVKLLREAITKQQKGQIEKLDPQEMGKAHVAVSQMRRLAEQLEMLGEPAGPEFQRRAIIDSPTYNLSQSYAASGAGAPYLLKIRAMITKSAEARANTIKKAEAQAAKGNWEGAEDTLYDMLNKLDSITQFLSQAENESIYIPFSQIRSQVSSHMNTIRREAAAKIIAERLEKLTPDLDGYLAEVKQAAEEIASSGEAKIDDKSLKGPAAFGHFMQRWQKLHAAVQRFDGVELASRYRVGERPPNAVLQRYSTAFAGEATTAMASIILADAAGGSANDVGEHYVEYLQAAALPLARMSTTGPAQTLSSALKKLADKSPEFAENAVNYALATDELLRWRGRKAVAQAYAKEAAYAPIATPVRAATTGKGFAQGLFSEQQPDYSLPRILAPTADFIPAASTQLANKKVRVPGARGLANGKSAVTTLTQRIYATYKPSPEAWQPQLAALEADLFVSETAPPLSLTAAMAVESAKSGDFESLGGEINGLHIEGYVTRLATLPDAAWMMLPLGAIHEHPSNQQASDILNHAVVRCELVPAWGQHRSFFVEW